MSILDKHIALVNEQLAFHKAMAERHKNNPFRKEKHIETAEKFQSLLDDLQIANRELDSHPMVAAIEGVPQQLRLSLTPDEVEGLPEALLNELSISTADRLEFEIVGMLRNTPFGILSLDQIIVKLYKLTGEIHKRQTVTSRLYRMAQKNLIFNVPGKKGVYSARQLNQSEVDRLFEGTNLLEEFKE